MDNEQTTADKLENLVYAAMETGNTYRARQIIAACNSSEELEWAEKVRVSVLKDYGVRL